jgi:hypothetical protein
MNEIIVRKFGFIPECLSNFFIKDVLDSYFETEVEMMPSLVNLTYDISDPIGFQAASYHDTKGKSIDKYINEISNLYGDEKSTMYYTLVDKNFQQTFEDVMKLVDGFNLSYCFLDDPGLIRKNLRHYGTEVW